MGKSTRKVQNAAPHHDGRSWLMWLTCGHQLVVPMRRNRAGDLYPAEARKWCPTCQNGPPLLDGQIDIDEVLGMDTSDLPPF